MGLPILTNWKRDSYDSILVIVDRLTKMIHYKLVKVTINALDLAGTIITDGGLFSPQSSGYCYAISLTSS